MILVPDTSVVIDGRVTALIEQGEYHGATIIIPEAVFAELEAQANQGREIGFSGLAELQKLCKMMDEGLIHLEYVGSRPKLEQVKLAGGGEIDSMIREVAIAHNATFLTSDHVQAEVARAKGLCVVFLKSEISDNFSPLLIDTFFDENTLAVYLKERVPPYARKGTICESKLVQIRETPLSEYELRAISQECLERAKRHPDGSVEIEMPGVTVSQIGSMRITITRPPFSDGIEITIVRPIRDVSFDSYNYAITLKERLLIDNGGMLIVGPPGSGKSTLEQNIATYLSAENYIVKTIGSLRGLMVSDKITQYPSLDGNISVTGEVLTLLRPDYVVFDEMRRYEELAVFANLRLSGIRVIGGLHACSVSDALIRLTSLVDLNLIPQIIATVVLIKNGNIADLCNVHTIFGVPSSLEKIGNPLIRPIVQFTSIVTNAVVAEAFRYENEIIVTSGECLSPGEPLQSSSVELVEDTSVSALFPSIDGNIASDEDAFHISPSIHAMPTYEVTEDNPAWLAIEKEIQKEICRFTEGEIIVRMINDTKAAVYIDDADVPAAIGKAGKNISSVVSKVGVGIDVRPLSDLSERELSTVPVGIDSTTTFKIRSEKKQLSLICPEYSNKIVDIFSGKEYLFTATVDSHGEIHLARNSSIAMEMIRRYSAGEDLKIRPVD
ncbi:MAG TPA: PINc/VapC family ATPase [Methanocorpusculum sp.]|nr:PINc/VapC family ATPase [Methanocorpusculum sp.]